MAPRLLHLLPSQPNSGFATTPDSSLASAKTRERQLLLLVVMPLLLVANLVPSSKARSPERSRSLYSMQNQSNTPRISPSCNILQSKKTHLLILPPKTPGVFPPNTNRCGALHRSSPRGSRHLYGAGDLPQDWVRVAEAHRLCQDLNGGGSGCAGGSRWVRGWDLGSSLRTSNGNMRVLKKKTRTEDLNMLQKEV